MSVINDVLLAVLGLVNTKTRTVLIGSLPPDNSVAAYISGGSPDTTFQDKEMAYSLLISLECKNASQKTASDELNDIHKLLTMATSYPETTAYQITNIETVTSPYYVGREQNSQHIYGSTLRVKFYYKKGLTE